MPSTALDKGDTEFTVLDGGADLGYEEMICARATGASTSSNLLQYLVDGEPSETVCAAAASGNEMLASLFATAATKQIVASSRNGRRVGRQVTAPRPFSVLEVWT